MAAARRTHPREAQLWDLEWRRPQALIWECDAPENDVALYVRRRAEAETPGASSASVDTLRRLADNLLLTVPALRRAGLAIADEDTKPAAGVTTIRPSARERWQAAPTPADDQGLRVTSRERFRRVPAAPDLTEETPHDDMTTPDIDAAREAMAAAEAKVGRLRAKLRAQLADQDARGHGEDRPERQRLGWADGVAEARRRHGTGSGHQREGGLERGGSRSGPGLPRHDAVLPRRPDRAADVQLRPPVHPGAGQVRRELGGTVMRRPR